MVLFVCSDSAYLDDASLASPTVRHSNCQLLIPPGSKSDRCPPCSKHRDVLRVKSWRLDRSQQKTTLSKTDPTSHANHRYLSTSELVERLQLQHHLYRNTEKQLARIKSKIAEDTERRGVTLDEQAHKGLHEIMSSENDRILQAYPPDSFPRLFWAQQLQAASLKDPKGMRWHPLLIKWCIYLRHRSSGAYEALRESGCIHLPSQRTLRDYTHYVRSAAGFSTEVDEMLMKAAEVQSCEEWQKCVLLLLDEMHIREGLVYDKHRGELIGFADLGDINNHLLAYEKSLLEPSSTCEPLASTMMVFMVRGLFTKLHFAYAQFPCAKVSGDLLYDPFWEAVARIEKCGLMVSG